jgi:hypothetical protein
LNTNTVLNIEAFQQRQTYLHSLLLRAQNGGAKNPTIMGGYLRNLLLGVPTNDIDLFHEGTIAIGHLAALAVEDGPRKPEYVATTAPVRATVSLSYGIFKSFSHRYEIDLAPKSENVWKDHDLTRVEVRPATTLDVIEVEDVKEKLNSFPSSISKVYYDLTSGLVLTQEFLESVMRRKIRLDVATCTGTHCVKIAGQFPKDKGWRHVIVRNGEYVEELPPNDRHPRDFGDGWYELKRQDDLIRTLLKDPNVNEKWLGPKKEKQGKYDGDDAAAAFERYANEQDDEAA